MRVAVAACTAPATAPAVVATTLVAVSTTCRPIFFALAMIPFDFFTAFFNGFFAALTILAADFARGAIDFAGFRLIAAGRAGFLAAGLADLPALVFRAVFFPAGVRPAGLVLFFATAPRLTVFFAMTCS